MADLWRDWGVVTLRKKSALHRVAAAVGDNAKDRSRRRTKVVEKDVEEAEIGKPIKRVGPEVQMHIGIIPRARESRRLPDFQRPPLLQSRDS